MVSLILFSLVLAAPPAVAKTYAVRAACERFLGRVVERLDRFVAAPTS